MMQALVFRVREDGQMYVDDWPAACVIGDEFLAMPDVVTVERKGEFLTIQVANGYAHYWCREYDPLACVTTLEVSGGAYIFT